MLPKPPFLCDLTLEQELEAFERLKPRLATVWGAVSGSAETPATSVVVPSLTLDNEELAKLTGASYYEERLLFLLIRLRNPRANLVYVTSQPVHPLTLDYYLNLLAGVPASHARARLTMLCAYDASARPLTQKVLERPRLLQRIRYAIHDHDRAYLTVFNSTPLERRLAVLLGIPLNGLDPSLAHLGSKSGSRRVFKQAGVEMPAGVEDIYTPEEAAEALGELKRQRPSMKRALIKLNDSFSGEGNAVVACPGSNDQGMARRAIDEAAMPVPTQGRSRYFEKLGRMGGVVEEYIEAGETVSPSAQFRTSPTGEVLDISTHDQILGGDSGQIYLGCNFPAQDGYRQQIRAAGLRVGEVLARLGAISRFGVDFLAWRNAPHEPWRITALEINLRVVGTTHPFLALRFLTGGDMDPVSGQFLSLSGRPKHYRSTDNLCSELYRGILPEDLIDMVSMNALHYSHRTESGVLFHMIGAVSEFGKLGLTVIGNDRDEADAIYERTIDVLRLEATFGHLPSGFQWPAGKPATRSTAS
ncbi:MAG: carboxylate-amine ligase [Vicinamibacteria bacterium]|nr:carboxylate-amine ligase [Vicinamibacteria bacterium]